MEKKQEVEAKVTQLLSEQLMFAPDTGHIRLFDQRMLLIPGKTLGLLRKEMIETFSFEKAKELLTRLGYQRGVNYYHHLRSISGEDTDTLIRSAMRLAELEGYVYHDPIESMQIDVEKGIFQGDYQWHSSWEAEYYLSHFGLSSRPTCWTMVGYANGFSTAMFGRPVVWREVECKAMGHKTCRVIGKPLDDWEDSEELGSFLKVEPFVDLPKLRQHQVPADISSAEESSSPLNELVGASAGFNKVIYRLKRVAPTDTSVLLLGESGVGKERFSKALHAISKRSKGPCVSVNCAAIPSELVESELFGVEKGAFTGANTTRPGRFERASGGTLFLDEIGSLPLAAQGKLLRAIQEGEVERVGGTEIIKVDVRIVAATNNDLRKAVEDGEFRADLFYRLNVYPIEIPPLKERREDIPLLFNVFVERYGQKASKSLAGITRRALDAMWHYDWPGNVRELENLVERAVILVDDNMPIDIPHLFNGGENIETASLGLSSSGRLQQSDKKALTTDANEEALIDNLLEQGVCVEDIEQKMIEQAMRRTDGNVSAAARLLKMGRGKLQYKLTKQPE